MDRAIIEQVKNEVVKESKGMRELNKILPVSGERIDIPTDGRNVNVVLYKASRANAPLIIGFHGGGFLFGGNAMNDKMWCAVKETLDVNIASVEYRKSPDYMWREALDDAYDALEYFYIHGAEHQIDPKEIYVMGCSAGANLAATLCLYAKQKEKDYIKKQILMYPFLDASTDPNSKGEGSISGPIMYVFNELHCTAEDAKLPLVSPVFAGTEELEGLPEAIICMADNDNLKYEGFKYVDMLKEAGVKVTSMMSEDMPHGYFEYGFGENFRGEFDFLDPALKAQIESGTIHEASVKALQFVKQYL